MTSTSIENDPHGDPNRQIVYHFLRIERGDKVTQAQAICAIRDIMRENNAKRLEVAKQLFALILSETISQENHDSAVCLARECSVDRPETYQPLIDMLRSQTISLKQEQKIINIFLSGITPYTQQIVEQIADHMQHCGPVIKSFICTILLAKLGIERQALEIKKSFGASEHFKTQLREIVNIGASVDRKDAARLIALLDDEGLDSEAQLVGEMSRRLLPRLLKGALLSETTWTPVITQAFISAAVRPSQLISDMFAHGKRIVLLGFENSELSMRSLAADTIELIDTAGITHLALAIPNSLISHLREIQEGRSVMNFPYDLSGNALEHVIPDESELRSYQEKFATLLRTLHDKLEIVPYELSENMHNPSGLKGELLQEHRATILASIVKASPRAKILALGYATDQCACLTPQGETYAMNFGSTLRLQLGVDKVGHILEMSDLSLAPGNCLLKHPIAVAAEHMPLRGSFGVTAKLPSIVNLLWDEDHISGSIGSDWDGIIYRYRGDDDYGFSSDPSDLPKIQQPVAPKNIVKV